jgi:hypothetical protein
MFGYLKVFKGGSWKDSEKDINLVESDDEDPRYWSDRIGFRCVFPQDVIQEKEMENKVEKNKPKIPSRIRRNSSFSRS